MSVWNEKTERTREAMRISSSISRALSPIFQDAMSLNLSPEDFCFLVNDTATMITLSYVVRTKLSLESDFNKEDKHG